jgi:hypothetical protein
MWHEKVKPEHGIRYNGKALLFDRAGSVGRRTRKLRQNGQQLNEMASMRTSYPTQERGPREGMHAA